MVVSRNCISVILVTASALALALAACSGERGGEAANEVAEANVAEPVATQTASLVDGTGKAIGDVAISQDGNGVTLRLSAAGLSAGAHGVHLHEAGLCEGPDFKSAGGHWNPMAKQHGRDNPQGAHLGDLANLEAGAGEASTIFLVGGTSIAGAGSSLGDADGTSLVVHAKADDYKTDPSGDSGDRIACAVLAASKG